MSRPTAAATASSGRTGRRFSSSSYLAVSVVAIFLLLLEPTAAVCPDGTTNSLDYCDNPLVILADKGIACNVETCRWDFSQMDRKKPPFSCQAVTIVPEQIDSLPDLLEPCLWWEMLYGNLAYLLPEKQQETTPVQEAPVKETTASEQPSLAPSVQASLAPSISLSVAPSVSPSSVVTSVAPSPSPIIFLSEDPPPIPSPPRRPPAATLMPTIPPTVHSTTTAPTTTPALMAAPLTAVWVTLQGMTASQDDAVRHEFQTLLSQHLLQQLPGLERLDLSVVRLDLPQSSNPSVFVDTWVVTGTLYYPATYFSEELRPVVVRQSVEAVVQDPAWLETLQTQAATPYLQNVQRVYTGLVAPVVEDTDRDDMEVEENAWEELWLDWENPLWIVLVAGAAAGILGVLLIGTVLCCCRRSRTDHALDYSEPRRRRNRQGRTKDSANLQSKPTAGSEDDENPNRQDNSDEEEPTQEPTAREDDAASLLPGGSEVTSVYSYLDSILDDEASMTASFMYPAAGTGLDDDRSVLWSVADGMVPPQPKADAGTPATASSPSRMTVVTAERRAKRHELLIFADGSSSADEDGTHVDDDDDDLSILTSNNNNIKNDQTTSTDVRRQGLNDSASPVSLLQPVRHALLDDLKTQLVDLSQVEEASQHSEVERSNHSDAEDNENSLDDDDDAISSDKSILPSLSEDDDDSQSNGSDSESSSLYMGPADQTSTLHIVALSSSDKLPSNTQTGQYQKLLPTVQKSSSLGAALNWNDDGPSDESCHDDPVDSMPVDDDIRPLVESSNSPHEPVGISSPRKTVRPGVDFPDSPSSILSDSQVLEELLDSSQEENTSTDENDQSVDSDGVSVPPARGYATLEDDDENNEEGEPSVDQDTSTTTTGRSNTQGEKACSTDKDHQEQLPNSSSSGSFLQLRTDRMVVGGGDSTATSNRNGPSKMMTSSSSVDKENAPNDVSAAVVVSEDEHDDDKDAPMTIMPMPSEYSTQEDDEGVTLGNYPIVSMASF